MSTAAPSRPHESKNPLPFQGDQLAKRCRLGWRDYIMFTLEGFTASGAGAAGIVSHLSSTKGTSYIAAGIAGGLTALAMTEIAIHMMWKRDIYLTEKQRINQTITDSVEGIKSLTRKTEQVRKDLEVENKKREQEEATSLKAQSDIKQARLNQEVQICTLSETNRKESEENTTLLQ